MNLDDIEAGSLCVIDTNVLLYAEQGVSDEAQRLIRRCASGELIGTLPQTVWQELAHKLMLAEAMMRGLVTGGNPAARLAAKAEAVSGFSLYRAKVRRSWISVSALRPPRSMILVKVAFRLQEKYGLLTNDALVLAIAIRLKADALVSHDKAFRSVTELEVYYPTDLRL